MASPAQLPFKELQKSLPFRWVSVKQLIERIGTDTLHFLCQHTM